MTNLLFNRISVLKDDILKLTFDARLAKSTEDLVERYSSICCFIDSLVSDLQKPQDEQPDYDDYGEPL